MGGTNSTGIKAVEPFGLDAVARVKLLGRRSPFLTSPGRNTWTTRWGLRARRVGEAAHPDPAVARAGQYHQESVFDDVLVQIRVKNTFVDAFRRAWLPALLLPWPRLLASKWPIFPLLAALHVHWGRRADIDVIKAAAAERLRGRHSGYYQVSGSVREAGKCEGSNPEVLFVRAAMKLHEIWQRHEEGVSSAAAADHFYTSVRDAQLFLLALERCGDSALSHPLTMDLEYHPIGTEVTSGAKMAVRGWRNGGWPLLRLLHGISWQLSLDAGGLLRHILVAGRSLLYGRQQVEPRTPFPIVLDAGAHVGTDTLAFAARWPSGAVYALEPNLEVFRLLRGRVANVTNVRAFRVALAAESNSAWLYTPVPTKFFPAEHAASATLLQPLKAAHQETVPMYERPTQRVRTHSLDSFAQFVQVDRIDFLHLDMQGAEYIVINAASHALLQRVIAIQVEIVETASQIWNGVPDGSAVANLLRSRGFVPLCTSPRMRDEVYYDVLFINEVLAPSILVSS